MIKKIGCAIVAMAAFAIVGCSQKSIIPDDTLADIFHDAFVVNAYIGEERVNLDSLQIYEPIFNRYGINCETKFNHVPDWYKWERECVKEEISDGRYSMSDKVDVYMLVDTKCLYRVGEGILTHNSEGFTLTGCDGKLEYHHTPQTAYSLMSDFLWYEIGDVIAIGTKNIQYHCFPKNKKDVVTKARLATEEMYTLYRESKAKN